MVDPGYCTVRLERFERSRKYASWANFFLKKKPLKKRGKFCNGRRRIAAGNNNGRFNASLMKAVDDKSHWLPEKILLRVRIPAPQLRRTYRCSKIFSTSLSPAHFFSNACFYCIPPLFYCCGFVDFFFNILVFKRRRAHVVRV